MARCCLHFQKRLLNLRQIIIPSPGWVEKWGPIWWLLKTEIRCCFCFAWLTICKLGGICYGGKIPREMLEVQQSSTGLFSPLQPERCRNVAPRALLLTLNPWVGAGCCQPGWAGGQTPKGRGWLQKANSAGVPQHPASFQGQLLQGKQWGADGETPHKGQPFTPSLHAAHSLRYFQVPWVYWLPGTNLHIA